MAKFNWDRTSKENLDFRHKAMEGNSSDGDKDEYLYFLQNCRVIVSNENDYSPSQPIKQVGSKHQTRKKVKANVRRFTLVVEGFDNSTFSVSCEKKVSLLNLSNDWLLDSIGQLAKFIVDNSDSLDQFLTGFSKSHLEDSLANRSDFIIDVKAVLDVSKELKSEAIHEGKRENDRKTKSDTSILTEDCRIGILPKENLLVESQSRAELEAQRDANRWRRFVAVLYRQVGLSKSAKVIPEQDKLTLADLLLWAEGGRKVMGKTFDSLPEKSRNNIHGFIKKLSKPA